jgi:hypothetical protein
MKNLQFVFLATLLLMLTHDASAQPGRRPSGDQRPSNPIVSALDKNGDGEISESELKNAAKALATLDKNRDGQITLDEVRPQFTRPSGAGGTRPGGSGRPSGGGGRPGGRSDGNESLGSLKVGSTLPDITVYDESGKELSTRDLRGKHIVLVFGCLT